MLETSTKRMPTLIATTSVASLLATMFTAPMTGTAESNIHLDTPDAMVRYINDGFDFSTSTNNMLTYENISNSIGSVKYAAYEMFGKMRSSTEEEKNLYEDMLARMSTPIDMDIFAL